MFKFTTFYCFFGFYDLQESLAFMFEMASLREDALREYDELDQIYTEIGELVHDR